jgi:chemotaxis protein methyltransferase WspC
VSEPAKPTRPPRAAKRRENCPAPRRSQAGATSSEKDEAGGEPECAIDAAREAANNGRLDEAEAMCSDMLGKCPPCADLYCLLGVIRLARGARSEAEHSFQRALYLAPQHRESLVHMMLISKQAGDEPRAENFRRRAEQTASVGD